MRLSHSVHIDAPVGEVFGFWLEPENQFAVSHDARAEYVDSTVTPTGVGSSFRVALKGPGRGRWGPSTVITRVIPNRLIVVASSRAALGSVRYQFGPEGSGTLLTLSARPRGVWGLPGIGALVALAEWVRHEHLLARLKAMAESRAVREVGVGQPIQLGLLCSGAASASGWVDGLSPGRASSLRVYALDAPAPAAIPPPRGDWK